MKNVKLSIILPCYRSEDYIENIISDIRNQTVEDWELLVISNGGGREKQEKVIEHFLSDRRIKLISLTLGNVSNARNVGMEIAHGEWLSFVDADDRILPNHFEMMLDYAIEDIDMVVCGFLQISKKEQKEWRVSFKSRDYLIRCLPYGWFYPWNKLFRTNTVRNWGEKFDARLTYQEDAVFVASFMTYTNRINVVDACTYKYICWDETNANSRYHASMELSSKLLYATIMQMMLRNGVDAVDIERWKIGFLYGQGYIMIRNLFKSGSPLSFREKIAKCEEIVFRNKQLCEILDKDLFSSVSIFEKLLSMTYRSKSPLIMAMVFECGYWIKYHFRWLYTTFSDYVKKEK